MGDPLLNLRAAELLAMPAGDTGVYLEREEAELVLEALAEISEVKRECEAWLEAAQRADRLTAATKDQGSRRMEAVERIAGEFAKNADEADQRAKKYSVECPEDPARHVAEGRARTWRFCAAALRAELQYWRGTTPVERQIKGGAA